MPYLPGPHSTCARISRLVSVGRACAPALRDSGPKQNPIGAGLYLGASDLGDAAAADHAGSTA